MNRFVVDLMEGEKDFKIVADPSYAVIRHFRFSGSECNITTTKRHFLTERFGLEIVVSCVFFLRRLK